MGGCAGVPNRGCKGDLGNGKGTIFVNNMHIRDIYGAVSLSEMPKESEKSLVGI